MSKDTTGDRPSEHSNLAGKAGAGPLAIAVLGDGVYFAAEDGVSGREPWLLPLPRPETIFANGFE